MVLLPEKYIITFKTTCEVTMEKTGHPAGNTREECIRCGRLLPSLPRAIVIVRINAPDFNWELLLCRKCGDGMMEKAKNLKFKAPKKPGRKIIVRKMGE